MLTPRYAAFLPTSGPKTLGIEIALGTAGFATIREGKASYDLDALTARTPEFDRSVRDLAEELGLFMTQVDSELVGGAAVLERRQLLLRRGEDQVVVHCAAELPRRCGDRTGHHIV